MTSPSAGRDGAHDRLARTLAAVALALALLAVVLGGYAIVLGSQYREDVAALGETLRAMIGPGGGRAVELPMNGPPPTLELDDE